MIARYFRGNGFDRKIPCSSLTSFLPLGNGYKIVFIMNEMTIL